MREVLDAIGPDLDTVVRLVVAAVLGALIGLEREIHDHPAGKPSIERTVKPAEPRLTRRCVRIPAG